MLQHAVEMHARRAAEVLCDSADLFVGRFPKRTLVIDVEQLAALVLIQKKTLRVEHLERVVLERIMRRRDREPTTRPCGPRVYLYGRRGQHAHIDHFAPGRQQPKLDRVLQHWPASAGVPPHDDSPRADVRSEGLSEGASESGREKLAHHPADSGDTDFEKMRLRHQVWSTGSYSKRRIALTHSYSAVDRFGPQPIGVYGAIF